MRLKTVEIKNFRNITSLTLSCKEMHLFIGENGQGKTNILESLYVLALVRSHRTNKHRECVMFTEEFAIIKGIIERGEQQFRLEVTLAEQGKQAKINGREQTKLSSYVGTLPVVLFAPEDLNLIKGSPLARRRFLDMEIGQVSPVHIYNLNRYHKLLQQRNSLLKQIRSKQSSLILLEVVNEQLVSLSIPIWRKRFRFMELLRVWANQLHQQISQAKTQLLIKYHPSLAITESMTDEELTSEMNKELVRQQERELMRGNSLVGPHRDDIRLLLGDLDLHIYGSQGQQRTAALALKLAELELIKQETKFYPILLLDDVLSELDEIRRTHLLKAIGGRVQTFITATSLDGLKSKLLDGAKICHVSNGNMTDELFNIET